MPSAAHLHVELPLLFLFNFGLTTLPMVRGSSPSSVLPRYHIHRVIIVDAAGIFDDQARALCAGASAIFLHLCWSHPVPSTSSFPSCSHSSSCSHSPSPVPALSSSPSPARSPSPQLLFLCSLGYVTTNSNDDHARGYVTPFPKIHTRCIIDQRGQLRCPICPVGRTISGIGTRPRTTSWGS